VNNPEQVAEPARSSAPAERASEEQLLVNVRRGVLGITLAAASLLLFAASGLAFEWQIERWILLHGVLEIAIIVLAAHIASVSFGLWFGQRDPSWLVLCVGFFYATLLSLAHVLLYPAIVSADPAAISNSVWLWGHESMACMVLLASAFAVGSVRITGRVAALLIALMTLYGALLIFHADGMEQLVAASWRAKGHNILNLVLCGFAALRIGGRLAVKDRAPGLVALGSAVVVEAIAQVSYLMTSQVTDAFTTLGHLYKLMAFGVLYGGLFFTSFLRPYELLKKTEALFRTLVERSPAGITLTRKGRIVHANNAFLRMFNFPNLHTAKRVRLWELDGEDPEEGQRWHMARESGDAAVANSFMRRALRYDGSVIHVRVEHEVVETPDGRATLGYFVDLSETVNAQNELQRLANYDPLTGLPNRALLRDRLEQAIRIGQRTGNLVAVLFIDLDQFKEVNDSLGHASGDELLKLVATRLKEVCRKEDTFGRLGGDEFLVIAHRLPSAEAASVLANKLVVGLDQPFELNGREIYVGGSIGISLFPRDATDAGTMIKNSDVAMYQAKRGGGPRVCFYSEEMNAHAMERLEIGAELRRALEREEFELHYQPKIEVSSGRIMGVEGLLRWHSPRHGLVPPTSFIPILEETGLIAPVGRFVLAKACHQAMEWRAAGQGRIPVAVNLSPAQFRGGKLAEDIEFALQASGLPYEDLEVEITESLLLEDMEQARTTLQKLTSKSVRATLDDFGTGYSSLSSLHYLPVQCVKVDRTFVQALQPGKNTIVAAIINVAHTLGLRVVAEGVDREAQREILQELGCDEVQGYLIAPPMSHEDLVAWLKNHRTPHLIAVSRE
jgi:diguanylate cyclase (GGDEF)-like protein/PAS domain S-box-containing protein